MTDYFREVAVRLFARELNESTVLYKNGDDRYATQYLLTPTGARVNRALIMGTLTETENIGTDSEYWRARVADPTGTFVIYAGQYRPEAARFLSEAEVPCFVSVVGKINSFRTADGNVMVSVRPEFIREIDAETKNAWVFETAKKMYERLLSLENDTVTAEAVAAHYTPDIAGYKKMLAEIADR